METNLDDNESHHSEPSSWMFSDEDVFSEGECARGGDNGVPPPDLDESINSRINFTDKFSKS